jgi:hypothetical protein
MMDAETFKYIGKNAKFRVSRPARDKLLSLMKTTFPTTALRFCFITFQRPRANHQTTVFLWSATGQAQTSRPRPLVETG